jgi:hypothetical protein
VAVAPAAKSVSAERLIQAMHHCPAAQWNSAAARWRMVPWNPVMMVKQAARAPGARDEVLLRQAFERQKHWANQAAVWGRPFLNRVPIPARGVLAQLAEDCRQKPRSQCQNTAPSQAKGESSWVTETGGR